MNYMEAMKFLEETKKYGSILGLQSIQNLMACLGNVQDKVPMIHIGGTNGKGSVGAMLSSVLAEAGYRVGRFNTPDVFSYEEEFLMNGEPIGKARLAEIFTEVSAACGKLVKEGYPHPTRFEVETAAAFLWFYEENCDIALMEVGMGGETDATNIIKKPLVSVLTSISMDHMKFLGNSLEEIAKVKAGIIKTGCPVVTAGQKPEVSKVIGARCEKMGAPLFCASVPETANSSYSGEKTVLSRDFGEKFLENIEIGLKGYFQLENASCALEVLRILQKNYPLVTENAIRKGFAKTCWPGRFEQIGHSPDFYLDGAHNEDAVQKLRKTLDDCFAGQKIVYIMGVLADKDYEKMIQTMFRQKDRVFTVTPQNPRALDGRELAGQLLRQNIDASYCENVKDAVLYALWEARETDVILAFGSLSYLQEVRAAYEDEICK